LHYVILSACNQATVSQVEKCLAQGYRLFYARTAFTSIEALDYLKKIITLIHQHQGKVLVNSPALLLSSGADGLHLKSHDLMQLSTRPAGIALLSAACHNEIELQQAAKLQCDFVTLSPVKSTATHPDVSPLGWARFQEWVSKIELPVYALGGLTLADLADAQAHGAYGVAGVRMYEASALHHLSGN